MNKASKVRSKLLPIYIVEKNSDNTKTLNRKKINFQINFGNVYHINYKYFTPKGFKVADNSKRVVTCRYTNEGLSVPSITFTYIKSTEAKPVHVNYIDVNTNQRIRTGSAKGKLGQNIDVTKQVTIPKGYSLCHDQKVEFTVNKYIQSIDLMVKSASESNQSKVVASRSTSVNHNDQLTSHSKAKDLLNSSLTDSIKTLESNLQKYNCSLSVKLIHEILHHNLDFFKKIIMSIFANMKYRGIDNLKVTPQEHKVSGVIKKYLYNNNQVNFTFIRAKQLGIQDPIKVSEVRDFVTSVMDHNCSKGIFITTSHFTSEAKKEAERHSIILINDTHLARLMINNNVGVKPRQIFKVVDLDKTFFK